MLISVSLGKDTGHERHRVLYPALPGCEIKYLPAERPRVPIAGGEPPEDEEEISCG
jgi:hypothetical protein